MACLTAETLWIVESLLYINEELESLGTPICSKKVSVPLMIVDNGETYTFLMAFFPLNRLSHVVTSLGSCGRYVGFCGKSLYYCMMHFPQTLRN